MTTSQAFYAQSGKWLDRIMEESPVLATQMGEHRYDTKLGDHSLQAQERLMAVVRGMQDDLADMDTAAWDNDAKIDHTLLTQIFKSLVRGYDKQRTHRRNPGEVLDTVTGGVMFLIMKEFAPLPERLACALARAREIPQVLADGRKNLILKEVPRVWAETALETAQTTPMLFTALLPAMAQQATPESAEEWSEVGQRAAEAIQSYAEFLRDEVLPVASGSFAVGTDLFNEILREDHMVDYDADRLLETGWAQLRLTRKLMEDVAREIDPSKTVRELLEEAKADHPSAEGLLQAYRDAMQAAKQFVIDREIASIPEQESLRIVETPVYLRPIIPYAAYMPAGILEDAQEGIFVVTPVDADAPADEQEEKLKGHFHIKLPVTALHEAYPGHHLQLTWSNRNEALPRRMGSFLATLFIEGWAFYCEELMEELGFISEPVQRLGRLSDQLWRAARIILDVSLHTRGMTVDEAVDFLVNECQLERSNAVAEVRRYTMTPTQPQSYLMGKLQILDLIDDLKKTRPEATLREIHDAILKAGSLPPRLMRRALLGSG